MKKTKYTIDDLINLGFVTEVETAKGLKSGEIQLDVPSPAQDALDAMIEGDKPFSIKTNAPAIAQSTFQSKKITAIDAPNVTTIGSYAFISCSALTIASFPACTSIGTSAFHNCINLSSVYLMGSSVVSLPYSNAFNYTPMYYNTGKIYVPASLVDTYKTTTNWAYFSDCIVAGDE